MYSLSFLPKAGYNKYIKAIGHRVGGTKVDYQIDDNINLIHFLSERDEGTGSDLLYTVIADIVSANS